MKGALHSTENSGNYGRKFNGKKFPCEKFPKISMYPAKLSSFAEVPKLKISGNVFKPEFLIGYTDTR